MQIGRIGSRYYEVFDVFTESKLAGNSLAIVHDTDGLDDKTMQAIAAEFNLSETVFVFRAVNPLHRASLRVFTPYHELPFGGHSKIGAAIALAMQEEQSNNTDQIIILEGQLGVVRCAVRGKNINGRFSWFAELDLPKLPQQVDLHIEKEEAAAAIGLASHEIGFANHRPSIWGVGFPFLMIPVQNMIAAAKVSVDPVFVQERLPEADGRALPLFIYCRETQLFDCKFHARMFVTGDHVYEDSATGSAVAAMAGAVHQFDSMQDGVHLFWIEQGMEMKRPSKIKLEIEQENKAIVNIRIGGQAVKLAEGHLFI